MKWQVRRTRHNQSRPIHILTPPPVLPLLPLHLLSPMIATPPPFPPSTPPHHTLQSTTSPPLPPFRSPGQDEGCDGSDQPKPRRDGAGRPGGAGRDGGADGDTRQGRWVGCDDYFVERVGGGGEWGGVADTEWQRDGEREEWAYQSCVAGAVSAVGAVTRVLLSMSPCLSVSSTFRRLSLHSVVAFAHICVHLSLASPSLCLSVSFASLDLGQSEHNHDRY